MCVQLLAIRVPPSDLVNLVQMKSFGIDFLFDFNFWETEAPWVTDFTDKHDKTLGCKRQVHVFERCFEIFEKKSLLLGLRNSLRTRSHWRPSEQASSAWHIGLYVAARPWRKETHAIVSVNCSSEPPHVFLEFARPHFRLRTCIGAKKSENL